MLRNMARLCPHTVRIFTRTARDLHDEGGFAQAAEFSALVIDKQRFVTTAAGEEVVSSRTVYVVGDWAFGPDDEIELVGFTPARPKILAVTRNNFKGDAHHMEVAV